MSYLLDTNVVSELRKPPGRAAPSVHAWARDQVTNELFISVITLLEIEVGIGQVERRDEHQGDILRRWLERDLLTAFAGRVLPIDETVARTAAAMHVPDPRPERDALIAATALAHGHTVVTRNVGDFEPLGVALINPWEIRGLRALFALKIARPTRVRRQPAGVTTVDFTVTAYAVPRPYERPATHTRAELLAALRLTRIPNGTRLTVALAAAQEPGRFHAVGSVHATGRDAVDSTRTATARACFVVAMPLTGRIPTSVTATVPCR